MSSTQLPTHNTALVVYSFSQLSFSLNNNIIKYPYKKNFFKDKFEKRNKKSEKYRCSSLVFLIFKKKKGRKETDNKLRF